MNAKPSRMLRLDVECGMHSETVLHWLYGTVVSYEPGTGRFGFSLHRRPPGHLRARPPDRLAHRRPAAAQRRAWLDDLTDDELEELQQQARAAGTRRSSLRAALAAYTRAGGEPDG
ncbi:hypothetical protein AB5J52_00120 [Streptomyces sp. R39]|uniref:Ribbon-helix-helix protein CopG domain-containing protein n=1 Tax=Streptomyces sp. R39 TaxID=3238631 RepID=A0AB39QET6_9ACTN